MTTYLCADRTVFRFSGADAHRLLNDVLTGPLPTEDATGAWWALLTPQGKILAEGVAGARDGELWLDVHQSVADDFFRRMRMYKLRADVTIEDLRESHRVGWSEVEPEGLAHPDRRGPVSLGWRVIAEAGETGGWSEDGAAPARVRIEKGVAQLGQDFSPDTIFAHDIGMDLLEGIDFAKGCYVGQEVVSRMKHRGTARRRPVLVSGLDAESGAAVTAGGREAGTIGRVVDGKAVAILRLDRITDPAAATVDGKPVTLALPDWAPYAFGESSADD